MEQINWWKRIQSRELLRRALESMRLDNANAEDVINDTVNNLRRRGFIGHICLRDTFAISAAQVLTQLPEMREAFKRGEVSKLIISNDPVCAVLGFKDSKFRDLFFRESRDFKGRVLDGSILPSLKSPTPPPPQSGAKIFHFIDFKK